MWPTRSAAARSRGCDAVMIGRGMVTDPGLALAIKGQGGVPWSQIPPLLATFWAQVSARVDRRHRAGRLKQWLNYLRKRYPEGQQAFDELRESNDPEHVESWLRWHAPQPHRLPQAAIPAPAGRDCGDVLRSGPGQDKKPP